MNVLIQSFILTTFREKRMLQRLEWKWMRNLKLWTASATAVQAGYRGMIGRRYFRKVKERLATELARRRARALVLEKFAEADYDAALAAIAHLGELVTHELLVMQLKILYVKADLDGCITEAMKMLAHDERDSDARYVLATTYASRGKYKEAYDHLQILLTTGNPVDEAFNLHATVCMKIDPPDYEQALLDFNQLVLKHPEDMNHVSANVISIISIMMTMECVAAVSQSLCLQSAAGVGVGIGRPQLCAVLSAGARACAGHAVSVIPLSASHRIVMIKCVTTALGCSRA